MDRQYGLALEKRIFPITDRAIQKKMKLAKLKLIRVHDLRHTFAVRSMQKLKKSKSDIVTTLPYLSAYLGHCNMSATQIYLHLTAECYPEFIQKQCDYLGDTIPTWEAPNENC